MAGSLFVGDGGSSGAVRGVAERGAQAESAAGQARAAVGAFEAALSATVHPWAVASNRSDLVSLALSNLFGQNTPAIATAEAEYELMWAQDVAAMAGYHLDASAAASALPAFTGPKMPSINAGSANVGFYNLGLGNIGDLNLGAANIGNRNLGLANLGSANFGLGNFGMLPGTQNEDEGVTFGEDEHR